MAVGSGLVSDLVEDQVVVFEVNRESKSSYTNPIEKIRLTPRAWSTYAHSEHAVVIGNQA